MDRETDGYRSERDWVARALVAISVVSLVGAILAATIGAGLAPIPLIGLVALLLVPFPTLLLYLGATAALYLLIMLPLRLAGRAHSWVRWAVLTGSVAVPWLAGYGIAETANRNAGVADSAAAPPGWSPLHIAAGSIALVDSGGNAKNAECDAFCLSLLLAGHAREVIVAPAQQRAVRGTRLAGVAFALKPAWRSCFAHLRDYMSIVRGAEPGRIQYFIDFGFDPFFAGELPQCLVRRDIGFVAGAIPTLVTLRTEDTQKLDSSKGAGWQPPYAEQRILMPGGRDDNRRWSRFGYRYAVPAAIWPYGGNEGTGGTFAPQLMKIMLSTPSIGELDGPSWWDMIADSRDLASHTVSILDQAIPDRQCRPQPGPCVPR